MRIIDVDAHLHEPLDWVATHRPRAGCGPRAAGAVHGHRQQRVRVRRSLVLVAAGGPAAQGPLRPRPAGVRRPPRADRHPAAGRPRAAPGTTHASGPQARLAFCDERGIDVQFLNPTFLVGSFVQAARARRPRPRPAHPAVLEHVVDRPRRRAHRPPRARRPDRSRRRRVVARRDGAHARPRQPGVRAPRGTGRRWPARSRTASGRWPGRSRTPTSSRSGTPPRTSAWRPSPTSASPVSGSTPAGRTTAPPT